MKLEFIWQESGFNERDWIADIFAPVAGEQIFDGDHRIVLDNCLLIDSYLHSRPRDYYAQFRGKNAWLLHLSDETYEGGYDAYENFCGVFRNYWSGVFNPKRVFQFPLGYADGLIHDVRGPDPENRKYLWSFVGEAAKSSRPEMARALAPLSPHFGLNTDGSKHQPLSRREYQDSLFDSIFVPCPMGNVSLESFRVYEALECEAIPILEKRATLDYFKQLFGNHPLPTFGNWNEAARFVRSVREDPNALKELQKRCTDWWRTYKQRLREGVESFFGASSGEKPGAFVRWPYSVPGWQPAELIRHQTATSLARRVRLQLARFTREGRLRKTKGA